MEVDIGTPGSRSPDGTILNRSTLHTVHLTGCRSQDTPNTAPTKTSSFLQTRSDITRMVRVRIPIQPRVCEHYTDSSNFSRPQTTPPSEHNAASRVLTCPRCDTHTVCPKNPRTTLSLLALVPWGPRLSITWQKPVYACSASTNSRHLILMDRRMVKLELLDSRSAKGNGTPRSLYALTNCGETLRESTTQSCSFQ